MLVKIYDLMKHADDLILLLSDLQKKNIITRSFASGYSKLLQGAGFSHIYWLKWGVFIIVNRINEFKPWLLKLKQQSCWRCKFNESRNRSRSSQRALELFLKIKQFFKCEINTTKNEQGCVTLFISQYFLCPIPNATDWNAG